MNGNHSTMNGSLSGVSSRPQPTGIKVIVVGCGFAGLACAIECVLKGHSVVLLEKFKDVKVLQSLGDVLSLGPNAGRFIERWGLHDQLWPLCGHARTLHIHTYSGELVHAQPLPEHEHGSRAYNGHRGQMHAVLYAHARAVGVDVRLGQDVAEYWECEEGAEEEGMEKAGVVLVSGERMGADVVVGADGVRSKARKVVLGHTDKPKSSGYAIYRAWFTAQDHGIDTDPLTDFMCRGEDVVYAWIGPDVHFITSCSQGGTAVSCILTHRDDADIEDSWSCPGKKADVLAIVQNWDPRCAAVLAKAPAFIDWKLVYRDPLPTWVSQRGRVLLIGDAAHPFLPTSIQGASQAIEDGVALAVTLQLASQKRVPLAVRTWEHIRYERVRLAQLMGESTRDKWHRASSQKDRVKSVELPRPEWLFAFDAEKDAYQKFSKVSRDIEQHGYVKPSLPL